MIFSCSGCKLHWNVGQCSQIFLQHLLLIANILFSCAEYKGARSWRLDQGNYEMMPRGSIDQTRCFFTFFKDLRSTKKIDQNYFWQIFSPRFGVKICQTAVPLSLRHRTHWSNLCLFCEKFCQFPDTIAHGGFRSTKFCQDLPNFRDAVVLPQSRENFCHTWNLKELSIYTPWFESFEGKCQSRKFNPKPAKTVRI